MVRNSNGRSTLERAFELAKSGRGLSVVELRTVLKQQLLTDIVSPASKEAGCFSP
jgi:hypothetical protein